jgi:DNA polymerase V
MGPEHRVNAMLEFIPLALFQSSLPVPLFGRLIPAGFPSPADDYLEGEIDLAAYLIERPASTFLMKVSGQSMTGAGILDGDHLVVDRSVIPKHGHIVVAVCNGEMTVKRLQIINQSRALLRAEHPDFPCWEICEETSFEIWGVVVGTFRKTV